VPRSFRRSRIKVESFGMREGRWAAQLEPRAQRECDHPLRPPGTMGPQVAVADASSLYGHPNAGRVQGLRLREKTSAPAGT
jgi:hypothetical protein